MSLDWQICQYPISLSERTINFRRDRSLAAIQITATLALVAATQRARSIPLKCRFNEEKSV